MSSLYFMISLAQNRTVMVPCKFKHIPVSALVKDEELIPSFKPEDNNSFINMVHVAFQICGDMLSHPKPQSIDIGEASAIDSIPSSLYMFLNLLLGGQNILEHDQFEDGVKESKCKIRILSIAQDLMYTISSNKFLTPKHIGLASTLHQATRSKELVKMFHKAGHTMSYQEIIKLDAALAKKALESMNREGAVVHQNLIKDRFVHFSADNVDINEHTLDGKGTFHATQVAAWQRGPPKGNLLSGVEIHGKSNPLNIPREMNDVIPPTRKGLTDHPFDGAF